MEKPPAPLRLPRPALLAALAALFVPAPSPAWSGELSGTARNAVIFFVDDLGWTDLGCYGSDLYETPRIDALAAAGVKFTSAYSACTVCSPSRAALLTGQYPARLHLTDFIPGHPFENTPLTVPDWTPVLESRHVTLPALLSPHGYTSAHVGKWHLARRDRGGPGGGDTPDTENYPEHHGFDINIGGNERGAPGSYFWPYGRGRDMEARMDNSIHRTLPENGGEGEYLTDRLASETVKLIESFTGEDKPFFIYFSFYNVHTPIQGRPDLVEKYEAKLAGSPEVRHRNAEYAAMVESVDEAVGRVVDALQAGGAWEDTVVVFTSDNGGLWPRATDNYPLRQGKGGIYEGGVRVPAIVRLPGGAEGEMCHEPVIGMDFFATVLDALGVPLPEETAAVVDGVSLLPVLENPRADLEREAIFWHYPHYHSMGAHPYTAVRSGPWKLIEIHGQALELYDLSADIHENTNLLGEYPDKARELLARILGWREVVGAQMPSPNPDFDPEEPTGIRRGDRLVPQAPLRE